MSYDAKAVDRFLWMLHPAMSRIRSKGNKKQIIKRECNILDVKIHIINFGFQSFKKKGLSKYDLS